MAIPSHTSPSRVAAAHLRRSSKTERIWVTAYGREVEVKVTTGGPEADVLLEARGKRMTLFGKGGGRLEHVEDGAWVQDFPNLDAALKAFAGSVR